MPYTKLRQITQIITGFVYVILATLCFIWVIYRGMVSIFASTILTNHYLRDFLDNTVPTIRYVWRNWSLLSTMTQLLRHDRIDDEKIPNSQQFPKKELKNKDEIQYALKHAIAIYPTAMLAALNITHEIANTSDSTQDFIARIFGLCNDDASDWMIKRHPLICQHYTWLNFLNYFRGRNKVYQPAYYLIRDDRRRAHVLCIRGSISITDWITDANLSTHPFTVNSVNGEAHDGMLKSARYVYQNVINKLREMYQDHKAEKQYDLIVTGHSLGAGVASIVGLLFVHDEKEKELNKNIVKKLKVYSFATPSIVSKNIASVGFITSVVLSTDIVGRLSEASLKSTKCRDETQNIIAYYGSIIISPLIQATTMGILSRCFEEKKPLYPAGKVIWILPNDANYKKQRQSVVYAVLSVCDWLPGEMRGNESWLKWMLHYLLKEENEGDIGEEIVYGNKCWTFCDISMEQKDTFRDIIFDGFEGIYAHLPHRYAWAMGLDRQLTPIGLDLHGKSDWLPPMNDHEN